MSIHRSTKAAGKLKLLPEQPDHLPPKGPRIQQPDNAELPTVTEIRTDDDLSDGEEYEDEEELQDSEDVEV